MAVCLSKLARLQCDSTQAPMFFFFLLSSEGLRGETVVLLLLEAEAGVGGTGTVQRKAGKFYLSEIVRERTGSPFFAIEALRERPHKCTADRTEP